MSLSFAAAVQRGWQSRPIKSTVLGCINGLWGEEPDGTPDDVVCVRVADFDRTIDRISADRLTVRRIPVADRGHRALQRGDLLLEKSGGGELQPVGKVVLFDLAQPAVCSNFIARMPVAPGYDPRFLCYLHRALYDARVNTRSIKQSTGIQNLDSSSYLAERVAIPASEEQRAIADFLDRETAKIDAAISNRRTLLDLGREAWSATLERAVTRGLAPGGDRWPFASGRWPLVPFNRIMRRVEQGWSPVAEDRQAHDLEWGVIKLSAVHRGAWRAEEHKALSPDTQPDRRFEIRPGDFLLTRANTPDLVGDVCVVGQTRSNLMLCDLVYRIAFDTSVVEKDFVAYWLLSRAGRHQIEVEAVGSSQSMVKISRGRMGHWFVPLPSLDEQRQIVEEVQTVERTYGAAKARHRRSEELLREYRSALVFAVVTGQIDVRDAKPVN